MEASYGPEYSEAVEYLRALARNSLYTRAVLPPLRWHSFDGPERGVGAPINKLHPAVLAALMPGVALRVTFGGGRGE